MADLSYLCILKDQTIREAIQAIDRNLKGIVLVTDSDRRLIGTVTDGDVRRAVLEGVSLDSPVSTLLKRKAASYTTPVTVPLGTDRATVLQLMHDHVVHQVPVLDSEGKVADLVTMDDLFPDQVLPLQAVIMAGGFGKRLHPLTESTPKPMLPVGDRPLMERMIDQLRQAGIRRVNVTTHYLPEKISDHFGDGSAFGVELNYVTEDSPLGTAGALGLMTAPSEPLLVINGDLLTRVNFRAMLAYHRDHKADLTVAVRQFGLQVPYGVIESDGVAVTGLKEKPLVNFLVNAGMYLLEPAVYDYIDNGERSDMPDLIHRLIAAKKTVVTFPIHEYWLDIGHYDDYLRAQEDVKDGGF
jgi:dTDP-glucose pyrophosphorylase/CBS domain-containing protein